MGYINVKELNTGENESRTLGTITIDGIVFKSIGHNMLETTNTLSYVEEPKRSTDLSMPDIEVVERYIVPRVKVGFKFIEATEFVKLRQLLMVRIQHTVEYYDNDFGNYVTHSMYIEPAELTAFYSLGQRVLGVQEFSVTFIGTRNSEPAYVVRLTVNEPPEDIPVYDVSKEYRANQTVKSDNTATAKYYRCLQTCRGVALTDTEFWEILDGRIIPDSSIMVLWGTAYVIPSIEGVYPVATADGKRFAEKYLDITTGIIYAVGESVIITQETTLQAIYE